MIAMLLALDTATATASVALYNLEQRYLLAEFTWLARRRHTQELLVTARMLLQRMQHDPDAISALAVTTGPGSFTGVRIAISVVKGLALGLPSPPRVLGLPTLSVTAAPWLAIATPPTTRPTQITTQPASPIEPHPESGQELVLYASIQAGRARHNWCRFAPGDRLRRPTAAEHGAGLVAEFCAVLENEAAQQIWLVGEIDEQLAAAVAQLPRVHRVSNADSWRRAGTLAELAADHLALGVNDDLHALQPLYLQSLA